jgi:tetratricopeptide (TPR) repeat protein
MNNLGSRLSNLGRREAALSASEEAVAIYRRLAETRPEAFLPNLASSLNNLGIRLSDLGRREKALSASEEAVAIRRRLAETRPAVFLSNLANSLDTLSAALTSLGRHEEALQARQEEAAIKARLGLPPRAGGRPEEERAQDPVPAPRSGMSWGLKAAFAVLLIGIAVLSGVALAGGFGIVELLRQLGVASSR